jgi:hypothetical protein
LKPKCDTLLSTFGFKFNSRRYSQEDGFTPMHAAAYFGKAVQVDPD